MTPEPMSDARLNELDSWGGKLVSEAQRFQGFGELVRELKRLRAIPPDVQAAMEDYKRGVRIKHDMALIINWAVSHFGKDGASTPRQASRNLSG